MSLGHLEEATAVAGHAESTRYQIIPSAYESKKLAELEFAKDSNLGSRCAANGFSASESVGSIAVFLGSHEIAAPSGLLMKYSRGRDVMQLLLFAPGADESELKPKLRIERGEKSIELHIDGLPECAVEEASSVGETIRIYQSSDDELKPHKLKDVEKEIEKLKKDDLPQEKWTRPTIS